MADNKSKVTGIGLKEFLSEVDAHIEDIVSGQVKSNPLAPVEPNVVEEAKKEVTSATSSMLDDTSEEGIIGSPVKNVISVIYKDGVKKRYANAVVAAEHEGVYKVTARNYAKSNKVDDKGSTWSYEDEETKTNE